MKSIKKISAVQKRSGGVRHLNVGQTFLSTLAKDPSPFLRNISRRIDRVAIRKNVKRSNNLLRVLAAASPKSSENLLSGIAVDLADFWDIAKEHQRRVKELSAMHFPRDKRRLENMLYEFEIGLVVHAEYHVKALKRRLAHLKRDLKLS
jgi:hypothetical protein